MADIGVKPVRKGMGLSHPIDGPLADEGGVWRDDQFTLRRLRDKDIKRVEADEEDDGEVASKKVHRPRHKSDHALETPVPASADLPPAEPSAPATAQE